MTQLTHEDKQALLRLARTAIESKLIKQAKVERPETTNPAMTEKRGCFVTLHKKGALRGCIGTIEPLMPLVDGVAENAVSSAFRDPRFPRLSREELADIDIEISVLSAPRDLSYKDADDLLQQLKPGVHGVIMELNANRSTFLPQVWEQLPDKIVFLQHLCLKGGMDQDCWKDGKINIKVYEAEYF